MKTNDELPEKFRINPAGLPQSPWDQGATRVVSTPGTTNRELSSSPAVAIPGGEKISHAELAAYSDRPDRDYGGAGKANIPDPSFPTGPTGPSRTRPESGQGGSTGLPAVPGEKAWGGQRG